MPDEQNKESIQLSDPSQRDGIVAVIHDLLLSYTLPARFLNLFHWDGNTRYARIYSPMRDITLTDGATVALDASLGHMFKLTAGGNRTISPPTNPSANQKIIIKHKASGGARTLTLSTSTGGFRFGTSITGVGSTTSGLTDYIGCIYNVDDNVWDVVAFTPGF